MIKSVADTLDSQETFKSAQPLKLKFHVKLVGFVAATFALSLVFEGWRQVKANPSLEHLLLLVSGILLTLALLWLNAFWIYIEEKSKGTLTKRIAHFDRLEALFVRSSICLNNTEAVREQPAVGENT